MTMNNQPPPPAPGTDDAPAAINRAIAEALGWTCFDKNILGEPNAIDPKGVARSVPDYCGDHAAALTLLEHVLTLDYEITSIQELHARAIPYHVRLGPAWNRPAGKSIHETANTLPLAIAKSCLAALRAIEGGETT